MMMATKNRADVGEAEIQAKVDEHTEQGFVGKRVDPQPNSIYAAPRPATPKASKKASE